MLRQVLDEFLLIKLGASKLRRTSFGTKRVLDFEWCRNRSSVLQTVIGRLSGNLTQVTGDSDQHSKRDCHGVLEAIFQEHVS